MTCKAWMEKGLLVDKPNEPKITYIGRGCHYFSHLKKKLKASHLYSAFPQNFHHIKGALQ